MSNKKESAEEKMESIESALTTAESFILANQKKITNTLLVILICAVGVIAFFRYYVTPRQQEAAVQLFPAEKYFAADSLQVALNGDGNNLGFLDIIDQYGATPSGKLSYYYAGICYLRLGEFENAIKYLKQYKGKDQIIANIAIGALGDAEAELGHTNEAIAYYLKAAENTVNEETTPIYLFRAGLLYEKSAAYDRALALYERIQAEYGSSAEGRYIEKYISRVQNAAGVK